MMNSKERYLSPQEVALALKFAHAKGSWKAVVEVITEIENQYGELPLSKLFPPELLEIAEKSGKTVDELFLEMMEECKMDNEHFESLDVNNYVVEGNVIPEA